MVMCEKMKLDRYNESAIRLAMSYSMDLSLGSEIMVNTAVFVGCFFGLYGHWVKFLLCFLIGWLPIIAKHIAKRRFERKWWHIYLSNNLPELKSADDVEVYEMSVVAQHESQFLLSQFGDASEWSWDNPLPIGERLRDGELVVEVGRRLPPVEVGQEVLALLRVGVERRRLLEDGEDLLLVPLQRAEGGRT